MSRLQTRFDHVVLTAANAAQARGYRSQLRWRLARGLLNPGTHYHVIPDPRGRRVGSFGATLNALYELAGWLAREHHTGAAGARRSCPQVLRTRRCRRVRDLFATRRILICHSGGDSRRVPAYAAQGKAFIPLPTGGPDTTSTTLFDLILARAGEWPAAEGQVLIVSGDVLLTFDPALLDFTAPGVTGVACPGTLERGSRHGVYVTDRDLVAHERVPVRNFLQKPDEKTAREQCAIDSVGRVLVDTGIVNLHATAVETVLASSGVRRAGDRLRLGEGLLNDILRGACPLMDLYEEFTMALAKPSAREYCRAVRHRIADARHERRLVRFFKAIHGMPFSVCVLPHCDFFHIGTSRELLANMSTLTPTAQQYRFANRHCSTVHGDAMVEGAFIYNSMVETAKIRTGPGVFLEACRVNAPLELAGNNILVGLPHEMRVPLRLAENTGLVFLPVGTNRWTAVLFGLDDDFKGARDAGPSVFSPREGPLFGGVRVSPGVLGHTECDPPEFTGYERARGAGRCLFLNRPVDEWLTRHGIAPDELWGQHAGKTLWEARLWPVGTLDAMTAHLRWMQQSAPASPGALRRWRQSRRLSLSQLLAQINHDRLIRHRSEIQRLVGLDTLSDWLIRNPFRPSANLHALIRDKADTATALRQIADAIRREPQPLFRARALQAAGPILARRGAGAQAARLLGYPGAEAVQQAVFDAVAESVYTSIESRKEPCPAAILHDQVVWVTTPVRLDFAGGWSDTPPICTEQGGAVLNAAITLNGQYPVQVMAKLNKAGLIRLSSIDLGCHAEIRDTADLLDHADPRSWTSLPKAALVLAGIGPGDRRQSLRRWLDALGGGLDLTIFSAVPKGSGLGTSSILGAALLGCLLKITGRHPAPEQLIRLTSALEQRMNTGGGWQDQVGGIVAGVKLIRTAPGADQVPAMQWTVFDMTPGSPFRERLLLYYTGYQRMARHILHNVVGRYLAREPETLAIIGELKGLAERMKADLDARDADAFGRGVERYWTLKKRLDAGSTNPAIERILARVDRWTLGRTLAGAGGGGFVFFVARDEAAARHIRHSLEASPPNALARFFDFTVDPQGLSIRVL